MKDLLIMVGKFILCVLVCELVGLLFLCFLLVILSILGISLI